MIKQHYSGSARRSMNIIWNAAGSYDFDPPFLAFFPNGQPDDYLNMIIGLTVKWLDFSRITDFFERLGTGSTRDEASSVLWLGIENCIYGKELPERPRIEQMRIHRAEDFFRVNGMLSEQQMSFMSMKVYDQEEARWGKILGRRVLDIGPNARKLARELEFDPSWDTDVLLVKMHEILKVYFRITLSDQPPVRRKGPGWRQALSRLLPGREGAEADLLVLRRGSGSGDRKGSVHLTHDRGQTPVSRDALKDMEYIRTVFGPCMYSDAEMRILENSLCVENDRSCRLWFTGDPKTVHAGTGKQPETADRDTHSAGNQDREARQLARDRELQRKRNEKYYQDHIFRITESIRNLTAQTEAIFRAYLQALPSASAHGTLNGARVWRLPVLDDPKVFETDSDLAEADLRVDLLLDASQSRMNSQELICTQALVISRSLENCHIPVRVTAFRSLRGYTVLERLKEYGDKRGRGLFGYYAGGWNLDGLCLKTMDYLLEDEKKQGMSGRRILLVLTDAHPNDSVPLAPGPGRMFSREYEGDQAVEDAKRAVRLLRSHKIRCGAIYYGSTSHLDDVHQIYGHQYVRIRSLNQLADGVGELLQMNLREI